MNEPDVTPVIDATVVGRYCENYGIPLSHAISIDRIRDHWNLERKLRSDILGSGSDVRWQVSDRAYSQLYELLAWHDGVSQTIAGVDDYRDWLSVIGSLPPKRNIFEVGSGQGRLLRAIADLGHTCRGTEITKNRGGKYDTEKNIDWATTDGIHLDDFEAANSYDVVISNQVIEHLHPDDLSIHFRSVATILDSGGIYVFSTPHRATGPHDLSAVLDTEEAVGLHLKEYSWGELAAVARATGFQSVQAATPFRLTALTGNSPVAGRVAMAAGKPYLAGMRVLEALLNRVGNRRTQQRWARALRRYNIFSDNIFMICKVS